MGEEVFLKPNEQPKPPESAKGKEILGVEAEERVRERGKPGTFFL